MMNLWRQKMRICQLTSEFLFLFQQSGLTLLCSSAKSLACITYSLLSSCFMAFHLSPRITLIALNKANIKLLWGQFPHFNKSVINKSHVGLQIRRFWFETWPGPPRCVLRQDAWFLKCLYPAGFMNEYPAIHQHPKEAEILKRGEKWESTYT